MTSYTQKTKELKQTYFGKTEGMRVPPYTNVIKAFENKVEPLVAEADAEIRQLRYQLERISNGTFDDPTFNPQKIAWQALGGRDES